MDSNPALASAVSCKEGNRAPVPEKLTADDFTGKFAYVSLDGRLINAELATSATSIGGGFGDKEAQAWEDFAPMQRVLIVAVSAAVAAAAKHKNPLLPISSPCPKERLECHQKPGRVGFECKHPVTATREKANKAPCGCRIFGCREPTLTAR